MVIREVNLVQGRKEAISSLNRGALKELRLACCSTHELHSMLTCLSGTASARASLHCCSAESRRGSGTAQG